MAWTTFDRWPFVCRVLYDPVRALDLVDTAGAPDHGKLVPVIVLAVIFTLKVLAVPITVMEMTVLLTAAFGQSCWRAFLKARTLTGTETHIVAETVQRQILERRDPALGIDPTHE